MGGLLGSPITVCCSRDCGLRGPRTYTGDGYEVGEQLQIALKKYDRYKV